MTQKRQDPKYWTTITIKKETWRKLRMFQIEPSDTFDRIINVLMEKLR